MTIQLTPAEVAMAANVGVRRKVASMAAGYKPLHAFKGHAGFEIDIQGACGELAVAKALGLYWAGDVGTFKKPDVGPYQVRTRSSTGYTGLALRDNDRDDDITILVTGMAPTFEVVGWIRNGDGKQKKYLRTLARGRPPAFVVPEAELRSIESLPHTSSPASKRRRGR